MSDKGASQPLPCPFCGASGLGYVPYETIEHPPLDAGGALTLTITGDGWYCIRCSDCGAGGPRVRATRAKGCERAVEAWNGRTIWA